MLPPSALVNHLHNSFKLNRSPRSQQLVEGDANPNEAIMSEIKSNRFPFYSL